MVLYSNNKFILFNLSHRGVAEWSVRNEDSLPANLLSWYNKVKGCIALNSDHKFLLYSHNGYFSVDLNEQPPRGVKFTRNTLISSE